jgi:hypothetical protein
MGGVGLLLELVAMVLLAGVVGGSVAGLAARSSRPGSLSLRELVAGAILPRPRWLERRRASGTYVTVSS